MFNPAYTDLIVQYNTHPYHYGKVKDATHSAEGYNKICGDQLTVTTTFVDQQFKEICFDGDCCAVAKASASLMIKELEGKTMFEFQQALATLEDKELFKELKLMPSRTSCAKLPWATLKAALSGEQNTTSE